MNLVLFSILENKMLKMTDHTIILCVLSSVKQGVFLCVCFGGKQFQNSSPAINTKSVFHRGMYHKGDYYTPVCWLCFVTSFIFASSVFDICLTSIAKFCAFSLSTSTVMSCNNLSIKTGITMDLDN